jgi:hypothetical protein
MTLVFAGLAVIPASAASFEAGVAAYQDGQHETALQIWSGLAGKGHFLAQYNLGIMHFKGLGVVRSYTHAIKWFSHASRSGFSPAVVNLAIMFEKGLGVPVDPVIALTHLHAGTESLAKGPCRDLASQWRTRIASVVDDAARTSAEREGKDLQAGLWTQSFLMPAGHCFDSVAFSGGKVQNLQTGDNLKLQRDKVTARQPRDRPQATLAPPGRVRLPEARPVQPATEKRYFVQMISLPREDDATQALARLRNQHADLFGSAEFVIATATLTKLGHVFRVRVGPFTEKVVARRLCEDLRARKQDCYVVQRKGPETTKEPRVRRTQQ